VDFFNQLTVAVDGVSVKAVSFGPAYFHATALGITQGATEWLRFRCGARASANQTRSKNQT